MNAANPCLTISPERTKISNINILGIKIKQFNRTLPFKIQLKPLQKIEFIYHGKLFFS